MKIDRSSLAALILALAASTAAFAQSDRGAITGKVLDPTEAAIAGASVSITNQETGIRTQTRTNDTGNYVVLQDVYGNQYTYSNLGRISKLYPVPKSDLGKLKTTAEAYQAHALKQLQQNHNDPTPTAPCTARRRRANSASKHWNVRCANCRTRGGRARSGPGCRKSLHCARSPTTSLPGRPMNVRANCNRRRVGSTC